jgi:hypothetical protein
MPLLPTLNSTSYRNVDLSNPVNWVHPLNRGLVGWWLALPQWAGGTKWYDLRGKNDGALTNMPASNWTGPRERPGGFGSLDFNGSTNYVNLGSPAIFQITGEMTLSAWIRADVVQSSAVISKMAGNRAWQLGFSSSNLQFAIAPSPTTLLSVPTVDTYSANVWIYVVGVYRPSTALDIYVNGVLNNSNTTGIPASQYEGINNVHIGSRPALDSFFNGLIDDVRIYTRALSTADVAAYYELSRKSFSNLLTRSTTVFSFSSADSETTGGVVCSGTVEPNGTYSVQTSGGVTCGGLATGLTYDETATGGIGCSGTAEVQATYSPHSAGAVAPWFSDSFEGTPPQGWDDVWGWGTGNDVTTDEGGTPPGGGTYAYRQWWDSGGDGTVGLNLVFSSVTGMPAALNDGDEFHIAYWIKYDPNFDWGATTGFKQIIVQGNSRTDDRMYISIFNGKLGIHFQVAGAAPILFSNVDVVNYVVPKGEWIKFEFHVRVSPETENAGFLKGWVNGQLRWDYSDIPTIESGGYVSLSLSWVFNQRIEGPDQKRYWDLFSIASSPSVEEEQSGASTGGETNIATVFEATVSGGALGGGEATGVVSYNPMASGGSVAGGDIQFNDGITGSGGATVAPAAVVAAQVEGATAGGILLSGEASHHSAYGIIGSVDAIAGGSAAVGSGNDVVASGGATSGGEASVASGFNTEISGRAVVGGFAASIFDEIGSGGAIGGATAEAICDFNVVASESLWLAARHRTTKSTKVSVWVAQ